MKEYLKLFVIPVVFGLLLSGGLHLWEANAQVGGGVSSPPIFRKSGNSWITINSAYEFGTEANPIAKMYLTALDTDTLVVDTSVTGDLTITGNATTTGSFHSDTLSTTGTSTAAGLKIGTTDLVVMGDTGNVGIGTTTPTAKLSVTGDFRVSGNATTTGHLYVGSDLGIVGDATISGNATTSGSFNVVGVIDGDGGFRITSTTASGHTALNTLDLTGAITGLKRTVPYALNFSWASTTATSTRAVATMPFGGTFEVVHCEVSGASTGGELVTFDINKNGTTILSTKITIDATETGSDTANTPAVISVPAFNKYDQVSVDIDFAGTDTLGGHCYVDVTELTR